VKVKYLSDDYFNELEQRAGKEEERPGANIGAQYVITDPPEAGDIRYYLKIEDGRIVQARRGALDEPSFTVTMSYDSSVRLQEGELHPATGFATGELQVSGDKASLLTMIPVFQSSAYQALIGDLRTMSEY
jgi:hypothetical protein